MLAFEERLFGKRLSGPALMLLRLAQCVFIAVGLLYIGGALHDALHVH